MKRALPVAAAVVCGFAILFDFFVPNEQVDALGAILIEGTLILAAFGLLLGLLNLLGTHAKRTVDRDDRRLPSLVLIVAMLGTLAIGVASPGSAGMQWVFDYVYYPLQSTMAALLAFFITSALYRAFRVKSAEAAVLLIATLLLLFLQLPFVGSLSPYLAAVRSWFLAIPVTAGMRGIVLGIALGTIATSMRLLLAVDQPYVQE